MDNCRLKKLKVVFLTLIMIITSCFLGCDKEEELNVYVVDGAPLLSITSLLNEEEIDGKKLNITIVSGVDNIVSAIANNSADIVVVPINIASKMYNGGKDLKLLSVNIFGVLHVVSNTPITTIQDLVGKTVYNIGQGGTPDITFKALLNAYNIPYVESDKNESDKVNLKYVQSASELIPLLKKGDAEFGILGEPAVTNAMSKVGVKSVIDITSEWEKAFPTIKYTQAGVAVSGEYYNKNKKTIKEFYEILKTNETYVKDNVSSLKETYTLKGSSLQIDFDSEVIKRCNLGCTLAYDDKDSVSGYLSKLMEFNPQSIGGKLPDDDFYIKL